MRTTSARIRDLALYILIACSIALFAIWEAGNVPLDRRISPKWLGLALITPVSFWFPVSWNKRNWKLSRFWIFVGGLLLLHVVLYTFVLREMERFPISWFAIINVFEIPVINEILRSRVCVGNAHSQE